MLPAALQIVCLTIVATCVLHPTPKSEGQEKCRIAAWPLMSHEPRLLCTTCSLHAWGWQGESAVLLRGERSRDSRLHGPQSVRVVLMRASGGYLRPQALGFCSAAAIMLRTSGSEVVSVAAYFASLSVLCFATFCIIRHALFARSSG